MSGGPAVRGSQAHMDVHAVAGAVRVEDGRENGAVAQSVSDGARHFTHLDGVVGGGDPGGRAGRHLILPCAIFRQERVWLQPRGAQGGEKGPAEGPLPAEGFQAVG